jgi:hypothetical protein
MLDAQLTAVRSTLANAELLYMLTSNLPTWDMHQGGPKKETLGIRGIQNI